MSSGLIFGSLFIAFSSLGGAGMLLPTIEVQIGSQVITGEVLTCETLSGDVAQQKWAEQKEIITEGYFEWVIGLGKINYALGCAGSYTEGCRSNSFDCVGLVEYFGVTKGILTTKEIKSHNSFTLYQLGKKKSPKDAERGDFIFFLASSNTDGSGNAIPNHIAVISDIYTGGVMKIVDNLDGRAEERELRIHCTDKYCRYIGKRNLYVATNGLVELAKERNIIVEKYQNNRAVVDAQLRSYLKQKGASNLASSFFAYGEQFNTKPEIGVCIAVSESGLGKNITFKGNIGNVGSNQQREFVDAEGNPDLDLGIKAIFQVALGGKNLGAKQTVGDLYTNGDCEVDCHKYYASGKGAQDNVLSCLSKIYHQKIGPDFEIRY